MTTITENFEAAVGYARANGSTRATYDGITATRVDSLTVGTVVYESHPTGPAAVITKIEHDLDANGDPIPDTAPILHATCLDGRAHIWRPYRFVRTEQPQTVPDTSVPPALAAANVLAAFRAMIAADPTVAFAIRMGLFAMIEQATYPQLQVREVPDEDEPGTTKRVLIDPHTGDEVDSITAVELVEEWCDSQVIDPDGTTVDFTGTDAGERVALLYINENGAPVGLPDGWKHIHV